MAQLTDFLQTSGGDLDLSRGLRRVPDRATFVRQGIQQSLNFYEGEWKLDTREGVPMFRLVFGQKYDSRLVEQLYRDAIRRVIGVGDVSAVRLRYDNATRTIYADVEAETDEGEDVGGAYIVGADLGGST